jgi:hypothetical protein
VLTIRRRSTDSCSAVDRNGKQNKCFLYCLLCFPKANDSAGVNLQAEARGRIEETERIFVSILALRAH